MKKLAAIALAFMLAGCATANDIADTILGSSGFDALIEAAANKDQEVTDKIIKGAELSIDKYCAISAETREKVFRQRLNAARAARGKEGGYLLICPGDPFPVAPPN